MVAQPAGPLCTSWGVDRTWTTIYYSPTSDYKTVYAHQFTALAKQRKREARAERDRAVIRGIARLHATTAQDAIRERRQFVFVSGKRWAAAQRARAGRRLA